MYEAFSFKKLVNSVMERLQPEEGSLEWSVLLIPLNLFPLTPIPSSQMESTRANELVLRCQTGQL